MKTLVDTKNRMPKKRKLKVHRNFKLAPDINARLVAAAKASRCTQTKVVEDALDSFIVK